mmetsp:Transcript_81113/g.225672  ORF Transcript_81113/g.225672 Transcript_81113/m.225672 type:complete len:274 (+) Transcript_81113:163-984(+)
MRQGPKASRQLTVARQSGHGRFLSARCWTHGLWKVWPHDKCTWAIVGVSSNEEQQMAHSLSPKLLTAEEAAAFAACSNSVLRSELVSNRRRTWRIFLKEWSTCRPCSAPSNTISKARMPMTIFALGLPALKASSMVAFCDSTYNPHSCGGTLFNSCTCKRVERHHSHKPTRPLAVPALAASIRSCCVGSSVMVRSPTISSSGIGSCPSNGVHRNSAPGTTSSEARHLLSLTTWMAISLVSCDTSNRRTSRDPFPVRCSGRPDLVFSNSTVALS